MLKRDENVSDAALHAGIKQLEEWLPKIKRRSLKKFVREILQRLQQIDNDRASLVNAILEPNLATLQQELEQLPGLIESARAGNKPDEVEELEERLTVLPDIIEVYQAEVTQLHDRLQEMQAERVARTTTANDLHQAYHRAQQRTADARNAEEQARSFWEIADRDAGAVCRQIVECRQRIAALTGVTLTTAELFEHSY